MFHTCLDTNANIGQNSKIGPSPTKSFWNLNKNNNNGMGFFQSDPILGELTCETCLYQCYPTKQMLRHIETRHSVISNVKSSSGTPETKKRKVSQSSAPEAKRTKLTEDQEGRFLKEISSTVCLYLF